MRASPFIISIVLVSLCLTVYMTFIANVYSKYPTMNNPYTDGLLNNGTNSTRYDKLLELNTLGKNISDSTLSIKETSGALDVIGSFFSNGYNAMKVTGKSLDISMDYVTTTTNDLGILGSNAVILRSALFTILIVAFFVGFLLYVIAKVKT